MAKLRKTVLAAFLSLHGCLMFGSVIGYEQVKQETVTDPVTGEVTRVTYWRYDDGYETTTTTTTPKGQVEQRRKEPPTRFVPEP